MRIIFPLASVCFFYLFFTSCSKSNTPVTPVYIPPASPIDSGWSFETTPVFADEFDYTGTPDPSKWGYDLGGGGWGNQELEYYTDSLANANVSGGLLHITALKQTLGSMSYTSARMVSKNLGSLRYGRIEASAKLPPGKGTWPAIWMLPDLYVYGGWPLSGEIDVMEQVGFDPLNVHFTVHNAGGGHGGSMTIATDTTAFHKYRVDWTPYAIRGYYDDSLVYTFLNPGTGSTQWPFDQNFHVLMNLAIGGSWGGAQGVDPNICPATMQVDYIRFYKMVHK